ncbi:hypothetical protein AAULR_08346, partial [Lacticaseibacillus rhamnosus MTCC 5462]
PRNADSRRCLFDNTADSEETSQADLETQISQLNQYYSSLNQQIDVMTANLTTVSSQADSLAKAVKRCMMIE